MTFKYSDFNQNRVDEQNHSIGFGSTKIAHISRAALHAGSYPFEQSHRRHW